tara:strand:+ start:76 stop:261 length:186 start_codon:yes stop_codon:yes gene_type:complete
MSFHKHDCDYDGHVIDHFVRFINMKGKYARGEVYCKYCSHYAIADYEVDMSNITWKDGDDI